MVEKTAHGMLKVTMESWLKFRFEIFLIFQPLPFSMKAFTKLTFAKQNMCLRIGFSLNFLINFLNNPRKSRTKLF